jgi:hypothetical protein
LPRSPLDMRLGPNGAASAASASPGEGVSGVSALAAASGGPVGGVIGIGSVAGYLGLDVTVVGLVTATGDGEITIDDGTGDVRIGGAGATEALSLLEPGDAVEVRGSVVQDDRGLLIQADPASIVILPGGEADATRGPDSTVGLVWADETQSTPSSPGNAASIRQVSPTAPLPDVLPVLGAVAVVLVGAVAWLVGVRRWRLAAAGQLNRVRQAGPARVLGLALSRGRAWMARLPRLRRHSGVDRRAPGTRSGSVQDPGPGGSADGR